MRLLYYKPVLNPSCAIPDYDLQDNIVYTAFIDLMNGERTADEIISTLLLKGFNIGDIIDVFNDLHKRNIIFEAPENDPSLFSEEEARMFEKQLNAFSRLGFEKGGIFLPWSKSAINQQYRLKEAHVTVIGDGAAACALVEHLISVGIGTVYYCPLVAMVRDEEQKVVQRFKADMYDFSEIHIHRAFSGDIDETFLATNPSGLVIYAPSLFREEQALAINSVCHTHGKDFVPYRISFPNIHIGPFHIHNRSSCFGCYQQSQHAQLPGIKDLRHSGFNLPVGVDMLCVEVVKYFSDTTDISAMNGIWVFDILTGKSRLDTVFRQPGCTLCGDVHL